MINKCVNEIIMDTFLTLISIAFLLQVCVYLLNLPNVLHKSIYLGTDYKNISYCSVKVPCLEYAKFFLKRETV